MFNNWFRNFNIWLLCTHTKAPLWELSVSLYLCFPSCDVFAVLIGHEGYFKAEGSVFHSLFLIGETLSLIKTCGPTESQLQATADLSGWGKGGQVDFQMHTLPKGHYYLQNLRAGTGRQEGSLNHYSYSQVLGLLWDDLCRDRAMALFSEWCGPGCSNKLMFQFKWLIL